MFKLAVTPEAAWVWGACTVAFLFFTLRPLIIFLVNEVASRWDEYKRKKHSEFLSERNALAQLIADRVVKKLSHKEIDEEEQSGVD